MGDDQGKPANQNVPQTEAAFDRWFRNLSPKKKAPAPAKPSKYDDWHKQNPDEQRAKSEKLAECQQIPKGPERDKAVDEWLKYSQDQHKRIRLDFFRDKQQAGEQHEKRPAAPRKDWDQLAAPSSAKPRTINPLPGRDKDREREK